MKDKVNEGFKGFSLNTIDFLTGLKLNNNKAWFEENRHIYEEFLLRPMRCLVSDLSGFFLSIDPLMETTPAVGKTISRIYRDTRFSNDKSLFRSNMWFTFKRASKEWQNAPGFFFDISPDSYCYGMGFYAADKNTMDKFRKMIDSRQDEFEELVAFYPEQKVFRLEGEKYKKVLDPSKTEELLNWYQRKNLYFICERPIDNSLFNGSLVNTLIKDFSMLSDFYHFLYTLKGI